MVDQLEVLVANPVLHIPFAASEEIIHNGQFMTIHHQFISEVGTHKSSPTCDLPENKQTPLLFLTSFLFKYFT